MPIFEDGDPVILDDKAKKEFLAKRERLKISREDDIEKLKKSYEDNNGPNEFRQVDRPENLRD